MDHITRCNCVVCRLRKLGNKNKMRSVHCTIIFTFGSRPQVHDIDDVIPMGFSHSEFATLGVSKADALSPASIHRMLMNAVGKYHEVLKLLESGHDLDDDEDVHLDENDDDEEKMRN